MRSLTKSELSPSLAPYATAFITQKYFYHKLYTGFSTVTLVQVMWRTVYMVGLGKTVEFKEANKTVGDVSVLQFLSSLPLHLVSQ